MTEKNTPQSWQAESLRLTAFRRPPAGPLDGRGWWKGVVGADPENHVEAPRIGATRDEGPFLGGKLTLGIDPARIDWLFYADPNQDKPFPTLGPLTESLEHFAKALHPWLKLAPSPQRLAVGVLASQGVPDRASGYRILGGLVRDVRLDAEHTSDFLYQINRPRKSKVVSALTLNRLSKWSVAFSRSFLVPVPADATVQAGLSGPEAYAVRLELDINTAAEWQGGMPIEDVLSELMRLATEIADRGDVP